MKFNPDKIEKYTTGEVQHTGLKLKGELKDDLRLLAESKNRKLANLIETVLIEFCLDNEDILAQLKSQKTV